MASPACVSTRHTSCACYALLVEVWVILDRPPNDPLPPQGGSLHQLLTRAKECSAKQRSYQPSAISKN